MLTYNLARVMNIMGIQPLTAAMRAYSPDFNPIEQLFAKLKALLRKAAERSVESLWNRIAALLNAFSPSECTNYFRNAGYAPH